LHLLRKCPSPVWIVTPRAGARTGVLAAVDTDTDDDNAIRLNRTIMELAISMAVLEEGDLHVVHAWCVPHEELIRLSPWLRVSSLEADAYVKDSGERQRARFTTLIEEFRCGGGVLTPHFVKGIPSVVIPMLARKQNVEVVVMATLAQTDVPGLLIGDTAEEVINELACSVLAIKPEGFVSPVPV
jgi:universal stress protein E